MKVRCGFVSNSSSCSFLIPLTGNPTSAADLYNQAFSKEAVKRLENLDDAMCARCLSKLLFSSMEEWSEDRDWSTHELHSAVVRVEQMDEYFLDEYLKKVKCNAKVNRFLYIQVSQHDNTGVLYSLGTLAKHGEAF